MRSCKAHLQPRSTLVTRSRRGGRKRRTNRPVRSTIKQTRLRRMNRRRFHRRPTWRNGRARRRLSRYHPHWLRRHRIAPRCPHRAPTRRAAVRGANSWLRHAALSRPNPRRQAFRRHRSRMYSRRFARWQVITQRTRHERSRTARDWSLVSPRPRGRPTSRRLLTPDRGCRVARERPRHGKPARAAL